MTRTRDGRACLVLTVLTTYAVLIFCWSKWGAIVSNITTTTVAHSIGALCLVGLFLIRRDMGKPNVENLNETDQTSGLLETFFLYSALMLICHLLCLTAVVLYLLAGEIWVSALQVAATAALTARLSDAVKKLAL